MNIARSKAEQLLKHGSLDAPMNVNCVYCNDPITTQPIYIGQDKYRHVRCEPGLQRWAESDIIRNRVKELNPFAQILMESAKQRREEIKMAAKKKGNDSDKKATVGEVTKPKQQAEKTPFGSRLGTSAALMDKHILEGGTVAEIAAKARVKQTRLKNHILFLKNKRKVAIGVDADGKVKVEQSI